MPKKFKKNNVNLYLSSYIKRRKKLKNAPFKMHNFTKKNVGIINWHWPKIHILNDNKAPLKIAALIIKG